MFGLRFGFIVIFFSFFCSSLAAYATPERDRFHPTDIILYHHIFDINTETNSDDARLGDGVCADEAGQCSLKAAFDELYRMNVEALINGPVLIRLLVDKVEWDETVATSSISPFYGWSYINMTLTIRGYERSTKSGQSLWIVPERIRTLKFGSMYLWLDNFAISISENRLNHFFHNDFSLFESSFSDRFTAKITKLNAFREPNFITPSFFRFFTIHGSLSTESSTAALLVSDSKFLGFGYPINDGSSYISIPDYYFALPSEYRQIMDYETRGGTFLLTRTDASFKRIIIEKSTTNKSGGGIYIGGGNCYLELDKAILKSNRTNFNGGALAINSETESILASESESPYMGETSACHAQIKNSNFTNNFSHYGAAIDFTGTGNIEIEKTSFEHNKVNREGILFLRSNNPLEDPESTAIKLKKNRFQFNESGSGGVFTFRSALSLEIKNSDFFQNHSRHGSLIDIESIGDDDVTSSIESSIVIDGTTFINNSLITTFIRDYGNLINIKSSNDIQITNSIFRNNLSSNHLITFDRTKSVVFDNTLVVSNQVQSQRRSSFAYGSILSFLSVFPSVFIQDSQILNNRFSGDSLIRSYGSRLCDERSLTEDCFHNEFVISDTEIANNQAVDSEVAITNGLYIRDLPLRIENSYFHHNGNSIDRRTALYGGLFYNGPKLEIKDSAFSYNHGEEVGGIRARVYSTTPSGRTFDSRKKPSIQSYIANSTISLNHGKGLDLEAIGESTEFNLNYSTITLNYEPELDQAAGLVAATEEDALITSEGMIIYQNRCVEDRNCDCYASSASAVYSVGNNLISDNYSDCSLAPSPSSTAIEDRRINPDIYPIETILEVIPELNGAVLAPSHALVSDSPAINSEEIITPLDTCSDIGFDQTGFSRFAFFDRVCDRGAVEHRAAEFSRF